MVERDASGSGGFAPAAPAEAAPQAHEDRLEALRRRGVDRLDAHRFRLAESLARRARAQQGAARRVLDQKLESLLQALATAAESAADARDAASGQEAAGDPASRPASKPLAGLLAHFAHQQRPAPLAGQVPIGSARAGTAASSVPEQRSPVDPQTLEFFRRTWSRLSAEQRLAQSRSALPDNAGPLNSQHLVHRALTTLRDLSPAYFERFMNHVDALMWLERSQEHAARQIGLPPRGKAIRKAAPTRRG